LFTKKLNGVLIFVKIRLNNKIACASPSDLLKKGAENGDKIF